jgi:hypothetical protein
MPTLNQIAKTIVGPNEVKHIGPDKLRELQDLRWGRLKSQEQAQLLRAAHFVLELFDSTPDGWVAMNGDDSKARAINEEGYFWTDSIGDALHFARKRDVEAAFADDDDTWHIRRVSDVLKMWSDRKGPQSAGSGQQSAGVTPPAQRRPEPQTAPVPPLLPVDQRSVEHLLRLFRAFVTHNAKVWTRANHHHPIWVDVAEALEQSDLNFDPSSGPDWQFIQPDNRKPHSVLLEEFVNADR